MLDEKTRVAIALKKFSLISPIINGQVPNITSYSEEATKEPVEMPHYGFKRYSPKTIPNWYSDYMKGGIDALKPARRSDRGTSRVLDADMCGSILKKLAEYPKAPTTVIYDMLVDEGAFMNKDVSIATVRRFVKENRAVLAADGPKAQMLRFAMEHVNDLWMTDIMYGPYVGTGASTNKKKATYFLAYIDDASRLVAYAGFSLAQDMASLRHSFKEAVLRRGLPKVLYTDNGKIYRSQGFEYLCANLGVTLLHHAVGACHQKGKIERFFRTVRLRFLSVLKNTDLDNIDTLNVKFGEWLQNDYHDRPHDGLSGETPLGFFLRQASRVTLVTDLAEFNDKLLVSVRRTVKKDATISLGGNLYETDAFLAGEKLDARYDPDAGNRIGELFLYREGVPVGTARLVNFNDNAGRKRAGPGKTGANKTADAQNGVDTVLSESKKINTISYSKVIGGKGPCSHNTSV
jgi:transposase InsO family protein